MERPRPILDGSKERDGATPRRAGAPRLRWEGLLERPLPPMREGLMDLPLGAPPPRLACAIRDKSPDRARGTPPPPPLPMSDGSKDRLAPIPRPVGAARGMVNRDNFFTTRIQAV